MGRKRGADFLDHRQGGGRRYGVTENRRTIFTQEQDLRRFAGVIGGLPVPGAVRVGAVKRGLHRGAQRTGVNGATPFKIGQDEISGGEDRLAGRGETGRDRRSEARRVGRECVRTFRSRWTADYSKKKQNPIHISAFTSENNSRIKQNDVNTTENT